MIASIYLSILSSSTFKVFNLFKFLPATFSLVHSGFIYASSSFSLSLSLSLSRSLSLSLSHTHTHTHIYILEKYVNDSITHRSTNLINFISSTWRSKDEIVSDVLPWTAAYGQSKAGRPARTFIHSNVMMMMNLSDKFLEKQKLQVFSSQKK